MVIEQYTITTSPKYNFPQLDINPTLPQRFLEQSLHSLRRVHINAFQLNQQCVQQVNTIEPCTSNLKLKRQPISLKPNHQETPIAAVDTSTIKIGETSTGSIIAIRGATTWTQRRKYRYTRLGPFIFHITEENKNGVLTTLEKSYFKNNYLGTHRAYPSLAQIP